MSRKPQPKPRVAARVVYDGPGLPVSAATADVRCGHCGQALVHLERADATHPLVTAGLVGAGRFVLSRPGLGLWTWRDNVWRLTAAHKTLRQQTIDDLAAHPDGPHAAEQKARLAQNRFAEHATVASVEFWDSPGAAGLVLPTAIECPNCRRVDVVDGNV